MKASTVSSHAFDEDGLSGLVAAAEMPGWADFDGRYIQMAPGDKSDFVEGMKSIVNRELISSGWCGLVHCGSNRSLVSMRTLRSAAVRRCAS